MCERERVRDRKGDENLEGSEEFFYMYMYICTMYKYMYLVRFKTLTVV